MDVVYFSWEAPDIKWLNSETVDRLSTNDEISSEDASASDLLDIPREVITCSLSRITTRQLRMARDQELYEDCMMVLKKEQQRMKELLTEAVTVLCKASLQYHSEFNIEGLLGITLDNHDIILININEHIQKDSLKPVHPNESPTVQNQMETMQPQSPMQQSHPESRPSISPTYASNKRHHRLREPSHIKQESVESPFTPGHPAGLNDRSPSVDGFPASMSASILPLSVTTASNPNPLTPGRSSWSILSPVHLEYAMRMAKEPKIDSPVIDTKPTPGNQAIEPRVHSRQEEERHWPRVKADWASEYAQRVRKESINNTEANKESPCSTTPTKSQAPELSGASPKTHSVPHSPVGWPYYPAPIVSKAAFPIPLLSPSDSEKLHKDFTRIHSLPPPANKVGSNARPTSLPLFGRIILRSPDPSSVSPSSVKSVTPTSTPLLWHSRSPVLPATSPISTPRVIIEQEKTPTKVVTSTSLKLPVSDSVSHGSTRLGESGNRVSTPCLLSPMSGPVLTIEEGDSPQAMDLSTITAAIKKEPERIDEEKPSVVTPTASSEPLTASTIRRDGSLPQRRYRGMTCQICSKFCRCPAELKRHMRTHTRARPYKCGSCSASFALKSNLTRHQRVHTGVREFACLFCSRTFALLFNCKKHVTAAHNKDAHQFSPRQYRQHALMLHMNNAPKSPSPDLDSSSDTPPTSASTSMTKSPSHN